MTTPSIQHVTASSTTTGPRGEVEHARQGATSINVWNLRDLVRGETHANDYTIAIYVTAGQLDVHSEDDEVSSVATGDSILIPAGVDYSMSATSADLVEFRTSN